MDEVSRPSDRPDGVPSVAEALDAHVAAFEAHRGPIYGLRGWAGLQILGGAETTTSTWHGETAAFARHDALTLRYLADPRDEGWKDPERPFVLVTTTDDPEQSLPWHLVVKAERIRPYEQPDALLPDARLPNAEQIVSMLPVDGVPTTAELLRRGESFAGRVDVGGVTVIVVGRSVPFGELQLEKVEDLSAAIDTWRRLTDQFRG